MAVILGVGSPFGHDPSAAILIDGRLIAAVEEERFIRVKHARNSPCVNAIRFCLDKAGLSIDDVDIIATAWSHKAFHEKKWQYFRRMWRTSIDRGIKGILKANSRCRSKVIELNDALKLAGLETRRVKTYFVEHHLAHASSAYHLSGFKDAAIISIDACGEFTATMIAEGKNGRIRKIKEICVPDSLGLFYSTITEFLGFESNDGEFKVMGMAPYGDASKIDVSKIIKFDRFGYWINDDYIWVIRRKRYRKERMFGKKMVEDWGKPREGEGLGEPYIHIAAATQKALEDIAITLIETYLGDILKQHGNLCITGGCALNVSMNGKILNHPLVKRIFVQPAAHDAGASLGAATYVANEIGERIEPMRDAYLGPSFDNERIRIALKRYGLNFVKYDDIEEVASELLSKGKVLAWFQGAMEWGPRALGNRSILGNPSIEGISDEINSGIKFREKWRPFCPSILSEFAEEVLDSNHPAPNMTINFRVSPKWAKKINQAVHIDGTARPQVVDEKTNPRFYRLLRKFYERTGIPALINTSLNRRGEPMACFPEDAINMFLSSGLEYLAIGDFLIKK